MHKVCVLPLGAFCYMPHPFLVLTNAVGFMFNVCLQELSRTETLVKVRFYIFFVYLYLPLMTYFGSEMHLVLNTGTISI